MTTSWERDAIKKKAWGLLVNWKVSYTRRPRVARAWGRKTKTHKLFVVYVSRADAYTVFRTWRQRIDRRDGIGIKRTNEEPTDVSVETASSSLWKWKEAGR